MTMEETVKPGDSNSEGNTATQSFRVNISEITRLFNKWNKQLYTSDGFSCWPMTHMSGGPFATSESQEQFPKKAYIIPH